MKLLKPQVRNPGNKVKIDYEPEIDNIHFNIFKYSDKPRPDKENILIISCFSEFGCEIVGCMYCIPFIRQSNPNKYIIIVGWHGREYLYRHLADEFWEINEENMWLREYARAFHHESKNLKTLEKKLSLECQKLVPSSFLGKLAVGAICKSCGKMQGSLNKIPYCGNCKSRNIIQSLFSSIPEYKKFAIPIPVPSQEKLNETSKFLGKNPVGIFARNRQCYGRNLPPEFYKNLISYLESKNFTPIWLGEKQSTLKCPCDHIVDFSSMPESRDLETTLAIVKQLEFTIQFWTASSRLSGIMGTPFILFESPDQIWGLGQEGFRLNLTSPGPKKIIVSHYLNVLNNPSAAISLLERGIEEIYAGNYEEIFGLLEDEKHAIRLRNNNRLRIGG